MNFKNYKDHKWYDNREKKGKISVVIRQPHNKRSKELLPIFLQETYLKKLQDMEKVCSLFFSLYYWGPRKRQ